MFFQLLQISLGNRYSFDDAPTEGEWWSIYDIALKHCIEALFFDALDGLCKYEQRPPLSLLYEWIGTSEQIRNQNNLLNRRCLDVSLLFKESGMRSCILKGQGNALMYPNPNLRTPGDIDIWVDGNKREIVDFIHDRYPDANVAQHHVDFPIFDDVNIEVHYIPTYAVVLRKQRKLDAFIEYHREEQFNHPVVLSGLEDSINVPTNEFNIIYQLTHIERHFFYGGIGLRQMIDFYFLLIKYWKESSSQIDNTRKTICELGLTNFVRAVMWIMKNVMGMQEEQLLLPPDIKRGKLMLSEIMKGGNFGNYDKRFIVRMRSKSKTFSALARNMGMFGLFPEESLSAPITGVVKRFLNK